jgi:hypothetical protein
LYNLGFDALYETDVENCIFIHLKMTHIARVFPRRTKATPVDDLVFFDGPGLFPPKVDEVHVSVTFSWDIARAEWLAKQWDAIAPVKIGGPAVGTRGDDFIPGRYLKHGYVITSRGCPNSCWFCDVWKRDGGIRELPIMNGRNVLDDNLLACSEEHIRKVFSMLRPKKAVEFTGGLEAAKLKDWHVELLREIRPKQMFFAYDTEDDYEPLVEAGRKLFAAGWTIASKTLRAYVLIGYKRDTFKNAEDRLKKTIEAGFVPMAMLWRERTGETDPEWRRFQRRWARPAMINLSSKIV